MLKRVKEIYYNWNLKSLTDKVEKSKESFENSITHSWMGDRDLILDCFVERLESCVKLGKFLKEEEVLANLKTREPVRYGVTFFDPIYWVSAQLKMYAEHDKDTVAFRECCLCIADIIASRKIPLELQEKIEKQAKVLLEYYEDNFCFIDGKLKRKQND